MGEGGMADAPPHRSASPRAGLSAGPPCSAGRPRADAPASRTSTPSRVSIHPKRSPGCTRAPISITAIGSVAPMKAERSPVQAPREIELPRGRTAVPRAVPHPIAPRFRERNEAGSRSHGGFGRAADPGPRLPRLPAIRGPLVDDRVWQASITIVLSADHRGAICLPVDCHELYARKPSRPEVAPEIALVLAIDLDRVVSSGPSEPSPLRLRSMRSFPGRSTLARHRPKAPVRARRRGRGPGGAPGRRAQRRGSPERLLRGAPRSRSAISASTFGRGPAIVIGGPSQPSFSGGTSPAGPAMARSQRCIPRPSQ